MTGRLNRRYHPPSRDMLNNTVLPAWYNVEKENVQAELKAANYLAITCDGWTSATQDHYLTVTVYYTQQVELKERSYTPGQFMSLRRAFVEEEIGGILEEFDIKSKVVAITVDNAANMDVAVRRMHILKLGCFAHCLNLGAQKLYIVTTSGPSWYG